MGFGAISRMERQTIEMLAAAEFKAFLLRTQPQLATDVFDVLRANQIWDLKRLLKVVKEACPEFYYAKHPPLNLSGQHVMRRLWADYLRDKTAAASGGPSKKLIEI
jgi:hypothetical protein